MSKKKCPICGAEMKIDTSAVCTSIPPMYRCVCPSCNCLDFIKTSEYDQYKEEPSLPSNLDEAAKKYSEHTRFHWPNQVKPVYDAFKAGAEWMAGQGEELTGTVYVNGMGQAYFPPQYICLNGMDLKDGDKVIVQIRKANEKEK